MSCPHGWRSSSLCEVRFNHSILTVILLYMQLRHWLVYDGRMYQILYYRQITRDERAKVKVIKVNWRWFLKSVLIWLIYLVFDQSKSENDPLISKGERQPTSNKGIHCVKETELTSVFSQAPGAWVETGDWSDSLHHGEIATRGSSRDGRGRLAVYCHDHWSCVTDLVQYCRHDWHARHLSKGVGE